MLQKLYGALAIFAIATMLASSGLGGYLVLTGKLNADRVDLMAKVLRGEFDSQPADESDTDTIDEQPIPEKTVADDPKALSQQRRDDQVRRALVERAKREMEAQHELVQHTMKELVTRTEQLDAARDKFEEQKRRFTGEAQDEGFRVLVEQVAGMRADQGKNFIMNQWSKDPARTVAVIKALKNRDKKQIFEKMKTPEEERVLFELLEQLADPRLDSIVPPSRTTPPN